MWGICYIKPFILGEERNRFDGRIAIKDDMYIYNGCSRTSLHTEFNTIGFKGNANGGKLETFTVERHVILLSTDVNYDGLYESDCIDTMWSWLTHSDKYSQNLFYIAYH